MNGEGNRDGISDNVSWNCGVEGMTHDIAILQLRERQIRNFLLALMVSRGVPMITMGDEVGLTHNGNNNPWSIDGPLNWLDWSSSSFTGGSSAASIARFFQFLSDMRRHNPLLHSPVGFNSKDVEWHGLEAHKPDWSPSSRFVAFTLKCPAKHQFIYVAFNSFWHEVTVHLPDDGADRVWLCLVNTGSLPPIDIIEELPPPVSPIFKMCSHSSIILVAAYQ